MAYTLGSGTDIEESVCELAPGQVLQVRESYPDEDVFDVCGMGWVELPAGDYDLAPWSLN